MGTMRFEHLVKELPRTWTDAELQEELTHMGEDGWELAAMTSPDKWAASGRLVFKRPSGG